MPVRCGLGADGAIGMVQQAIVRLNEVSIEKAKGERWFCSEIEAIRAGWQVAR